jgi:hypothetical protein
VAADGPYAAGSLGRLIVELAVLTGIAPSVWAAESDTVIATAVDVLNERGKAGRRGQ